MKVYFGGSVSASFEIDLEDALEEVKDYANVDEMEEGKAFMAFENDEHVILNVVKLNDSSFGVIAGLEEKSGLSFDELKDILKDYFDGKMPSWGKEMKNDFLDGIDNILEGDWSEWEND